MEDDYWNSSSVTKIASRQGIFDTDGSNAIDHFKNRSNPLVDIILDSSRETQPSRIAGASSARFHAPTTNAKPTTNSSPVITKKATSDNQAKLNIPTIPLSRPNNQSVESARYAGRPTTASTITNDTHSNSPWLPNAEEYADQNVKDRSTQYDKEMEIRCQNLLENKDAKLNDIRDYDKKTSLLRIAISFNTPSVTVPVLIFLENTLSRPLFYELIKKYPLAVNNYINMTKLKCENDYYVAMLKQFGRNEDVAMIRLRQASQITDLSTKMAVLDQAATELGSHPWWHLQIAEQRILLKKQRELQSSPTTRTVLEMYKTVFETDFRKQKQSRSVDKSAFDRSKEFETAFHMSPEIIMCGKLSVIMQCGLRSHYEDFIHQAIHQGIFGKKYIIAPEYLADMVYSWVRASGDGQEKASETAERFLTMIPDPVKRIYFAEKFQNYDVAIDTIVNNVRDRSQLENLRRRMPREHPSFTRATSLLENTKWKN